MRRATRRVDPQFSPYRLRVRRSPIHRFGVFAEGSIPARKKVIQYTGERISSREVARRLAKSVRPKRILIAGLNRHWRIDAVSGGSGAEYINHSCEPNLFVRKTAGRIFFFSRRAIREGEELTVDYRLHRDAPRTACQCGSPKCRGKMNRL